MFYFQRHSYFISARIYNMLIAKPSRQALQGNL